MAPSIAFFRLRPTTNTALPWLICSRRSSTILRQFSWPGPSALVLSADASPFLRQNPVETF
jgi:hypothetical protein